VRWPGWDGGQEHRFYHKAGKYTGVFWTTAKDIKDAVEGQMTQLELYSVAELKKDKETRSVKELKVGKPSDIWVRPEPADRLRHSFD
jgi:hypothetical protein